MVKNNVSGIFESENTYKLYRTVYEIIHPTISKRNISNYKIIIQEDLIPLRIFYPQKISKLEKALIYIPGKPWIVNGTKNYSDVCLTLVEKLDTIVIALDYEMEEKGYSKTVNVCNETLKYLILGLKRVGIKEEKITLLGDSIGASILANISMTEKTLPKQVLLYPALNLTFEEPEKYPSLEQNNKLDLLTLTKLKKFADIHINSDYKSPITKENNYNNWPITLIITGDLDPVRDEGIELAKVLQKQKKKSKGVNIKFASHGFLNSKDEESIEECMKEIKKFIEKKKDSI